MGQRIYSGISAFIFLMVAMVHLVRLVAGWEVFIGPWSAPHWISVPGIVVSGFLSVWGFRLAFSPGSRRRYHL